jgi:ribosomal protein S19
LEAVVFVELSKGDDPSLDAVKEEVAQVVTSASIFRKKPMKTSTRMIVPLGEAMGMAIMIYEGGMM